MTTTAERQAKKAALARAKLYNAAAAYIEAHGGKVLVVGGVQVQAWPDDGEFKFMLGILIVGRKPDATEEGKPL